MAQTEPMFVSPDNTGQVLIFPYYNAENGNTTSFHIVNTTSDTKALKVRFREYKASLEVLDFNLYLSPKDHFSFTVAAHPEGITEGGALITRDNSCTYPALGSDNYSPYEGGTLADGAKYQPFVNFEFSKAADSGDARSLAGYVEVIEMGVADSSVIGKEWAADVKHASTGVPAACGDIAKLYAAAAKWGGDLSRGMAPPTGGVYGISYHLNVDDAAAFGIEPLVIDDFSAGQIHALAGSEDPNLTDGNGYSLIIDPNDAQSNKLNWGNWTSAGVASVQAVNSLIMTSSIKNDVMTNSAVGAMTDWVINFPTKHYHTNNGNSATAASAVAPFTDNYRPGNQLAGANAVKEKLACETVKTEYYDREEKTVVPEDQPGFSPQPEVEYEYQQLCYEVTTLTWDNAAGALNGTLGNQQANFIFEDGWADVQMDNASLKTSAGAYITRVPAYTASSRILTDNAGVTLEGLPAFGFMATKYANTTVIDGALFAYGHVADHKTATVLSDGSL